MAKVKLLFEDPDHEFQMSEEDVLIYAKQIGIDINAEKHLMWIAKKGLSATVPKPWLIISDEKNRIFYYNEETGEKSWTHPSDKEFAALVLEERSKSLNSVSSDYGFESKLSSLADAPPLSSSGKNTPPPSKLGKNEGGLQPKKLEFGRIENRRGTQLAPVRLNALKMPSTSQKPNSGISFMPKGSTLKKNIKRAQEKINYEDSYDQGRQVTLPDDSNESMNSDEGSKYSYEESDDDDDDKNVQGMDAYDLYDASQLSPVHSADESPDALEINSLVQLGTKLAPRFDNVKKGENVGNLHNKESSPSLSLRKVNQPTFLKPLGQTTKKKNSFKGSNTSKKEPSKNKLLSENENEFDEKLAVINDDQRLMLEQVQKEWQAMQDKLEKDEKEKYEEMIKDSSKKLEEEELKLRNENSEKLSKLKEELQKKIEKEKNAAENNLQAVKASNQLKIEEEEKKLQEELKRLSESLQTEIKGMEEKNLVALAQKKSEFENKIKGELEELQHAHDSHKKSIEQVHVAEISSLQETNRQKIEELQKMHETEENDVKNNLNATDTTKHDLEENTKHLEKLIKDETEKYQKLLEEKEQLLKEITTEQHNLEEIKVENTKNQEHMEQFQEEVDRIESDLDLLREEKTALVSELSILKENINNEKSNLLNLGNKVKLSNNKETAKEFIEKGINTDSTFISMNSTSSQTSVSNNHVSCQIEYKSISVSETSSQTTALQITANKSSQTDAVPYIDNKDNKVRINVEEGRRTHANVVADKEVENALIGLNTKLDSRIGVIEQQLKLLQEHLTRPSPSQHAFPSQESVLNQFSDIKPPGNTGYRSIPEIQTAENSLPLGVFSNSISASSQSQVQMKCKCDLGDPGSCDVMQDVKNSIYNLNDILSHSFVPPLRSSNFYQMSQPVANYSSPFESFYAQFREMQEKHRLTELKHKCENEAVKQTNNFTAKRTGNIFNKESINPSFSVHSSLYSYSISEDPLIQARNIVLREQARVWKQQQQFMKTSAPHDILSSDNSKPSEDLQFSTELSSAFNNVSSFQQKFHTFEKDPEIDYNAWMTRLNALQLRIRSRKML